MVDLLIQIPNLIKLTKTNDVSDHPYDNMISETNSEATPLVKSAVPPQGASPASAVVIKASVNSEEKKTV